MNLRRMITGDLLRKGVALFFAVVIYWTANEYIKGEKRLSGVPIKVHLTQDLYMSFPQNFTATLLVRGPSGSLEGLTSGAISGRVDVSSVNRAVDGTYRVRLTTRDFRAPRGVKVVSVESDQELKIQLQRRISRELPVAMRFSGAVSRNYRISEKRCIPSRISVSGPENVISELKEIPTEPIPLADSESGFEYEARLAIPKQAVASPARVSVQIGIERNEVQREIAAVPVGVFCDSEQGIKVVFTRDTPPAAKVMLSGPATLVSGFRPDDLRLYVDVSNISSPGVHKLPVRCHVRRPGIDVRSVTPATFKLSISKVPAKK